MQSIKGDSVFNRYNNINNNIMKPIESILKKHCPSMDNLFLDQQGREFRSRIFDAMKEYAEECVKASLEKASKDTRGWEDEVIQFEYCIPELITQESNIVLL